ncbi:MAG: DUF362 domain-containing protein [Limisphaerales bacterium]
MKLSRRAFIKTAAAAAAVDLLPQFPVRATPSSSHRIVRAHHPLASFFDVVDFEFQKDVRESYYGDFVNQEVIYGLFDAALCALTGERDPARGMRRLVPYQAGERVFIKINTTTTFALWGGQWDRIDGDAHYNDTDAIAEPVNATIRALVRMGVPQENIGLCDPTWSEGNPDSERRTPRLIPNRVAKKIKAAFPAVALYRSSFMPDGNGITWKSNDRDAIVEFRDDSVHRWKNRLTSHRLPDQLIRADHVINLPIMKRHHTAGVTGALKNNFGTIASCADFHEPLYAGPLKPTPEFSRDANPAVDLWLNRHVGARTRLIVCDGIFGGWNWGENPPTGWKSFENRSPNCLLLGTDPVAMDSVISDHVSESLPDKVKNYPAPGMLVDAARIGLGIYESRKNPQAGYQHIDYVETNQSADDAKLRKLAELRARYQASNRSTGDVQRCLEQCRAAL